MILLDTHALIWLARDPSKLSLAAAEAIRGSVQSGGLAISAMTIWELAWLATHRGVDFTGTPEAFLGEISDHAKNGGPSKSASRDIFKGPQRPVDRSNRDVRGNRSRHKGQDDPELQANQDDLVRFSRTQG
jgi:hypothetical protein